jgi:hypothetical protein
MSTPMPFKLEMGDVNGEEVHAAHEFDRLPQVYAPLDA